MLAVVYNRKTSKIDPDTDIIATVKHRRYILEVLHGKELTLFDGLKFYKKAKNGNFVYKAKKEAYDKIEHLYLVTWDFEL